MTGRFPISVDVDELEIIDAALYYYRLSTEGGGPDDHDPAEIKAIEGRIGRYVVRHSDKAGA